MSPFSRLAKFWLAFIATVDLTFTAFFVPYIIAFMSEGDADSAVLQIVDIITGSIFLLDVFIKFHIGYVISCDYRTKVEMRGRHIAWYYFRHGGAWIDLLSVLPSILGILVMPLTFASVFHPFWTADDSVGFLDEQSSGTVGALHPNDPYHKADSRKMHDPVLSPSVYEMP